MDTGLTTVWQPGVANTIHVPVAQGTERLPSKQRVAGSNPAWDATTATNWLNLSLKSRLQGRRFLCRNPYPIRCLTRSSGSTSHCLPTRQFPAREASNRRVDWMGVTGRIAQILGTDQDNFDLETLARHFEVRNWSEGKSARTVEWYTYHHVLGIYVVVLCCFTFYGSANSGPGD